MLLFIKSLYSELSSGFRLLLILFSVFAFFAMLGIVSVVYPFEPVEIEIYDVVPSTVCVGDPVDLYIQRNLYSGPYTLGTYDVVGEWVYDTGQIIPAGVAEDVPITGRGDPNSRHESAVLRIAPELRGNAKLTSKITVSGRMFGIFPVSQVINETTRSPVKIMDCSKEGDVNVARGITGSD